MSPPASRSSPRRGAAPAGERLGGQHRQPRQRAVEHRAVDELALARALALAQRDQDPDRRHQRAAAEVGDLAGGLDRRPVGLAGQPEQPVEPEVVHVVARAVAVGPVLPVAGDRAVDEPGVLLRAGARSRRRGGRARRAGRTRAARRRRGRGAAARPCPPSDLRSMRIERLPRLSARNSAPLARVGRRPRSTGGDQRT